LNIYYNNRRMIITWMVLSSDPENNRPSFCARLFTGPVCPSSVNLCFKNISLLISVSRPIGRVFCSLGLLFNDANNSRKSFAARSKWLFLYSSFVSMRSIRLLIDFNVCLNNSVSTYCGPGVTLTGKANEFWGDKLSVADPTLFRAPFNSGLPPLVVYILLLPFMQFESVWPGKQMATQISSPSVNKNYLILYLIVIQFNIIALPFNMSLTRDFGCNDFPSCDNKILPSFTS